MWVMWFPFCWGNYIAILGGYTYFTTMWNCSISLANPYRVVHQSWNGCGCVGCFDIKCKILFVLSYLMYHIVILYLLKGRMRVCFIYDSLRIYLTPETFRIAWNRLYCIVSMKYLRGRHQKNINGDLTSKNDSMIHLSWYMFLLENIN